MFDALADLRDLLDRDRTDTLVVGTLLSLATVSAPVVGVLLLGYAVRAIRYRVRGDGVPAFDGWHSIFRDGLRVAVTTGPLHAPAVAIITVVGYDRMLRGASSLAYIGHYAFSPDYGAVAALVAVAFLELAGGFLSVATLVALASSDTMGRHLLTDVVAVARRRRFHRVFGLVLGVGVAARFARLALGVIPFVGEPLGAVVSFVALVVAASALAGVVSRDGGDPLASPLSDTAPADGVDAVGTDGRLSEEHLSEV
ncbi:hypothetical protein C499_15735 [Halogeometricum borinquense DSM 11551]|uniref:DUF4013 domain-containing protein n=1 Tax=Halogeometricum borinquense (strain ATCC 700274 / DSM 11551 / JCM 10706 / KCTC 4070 / PR3) TaxID=469382 RepID=E4NSK0_HALBP|nr:DUF4013 domain-containing protein [Halogeometricum borinquense]ADQ68093.1 hypothetical protein Hbor_25390 [Halogeometricum borinquense DSM 11551]ELY24863.1 hypothetical protein C499_15735 [Halogeometricum borinquense DSM 11551]